MKGLLIAASIGLGLASGSAFAADLPVAAPGAVAAAPVVVPPAPPRPVYTWTGCYINGGGGYGMWKQDHYGEELAPLTQLTPTVSTGGESWVGTVGAGCDYQVSSRWLIGAFGDYNLINLLYGGTFQEPSSGWMGNEQTEQAWAVGGRIGYLVTPKLLTYINAGYTQARSSQINLLIDTNPQGAPAGCGAGPCFIPAHTDAGWFIGGGTEFALWEIIPVPGLFWRIDYRYATYNSADLPILTSTGAPITTCTGTGAVACGEHMQKDVQTVTTGLVWRFNVDGFSSGSAFAADIPATAAPGVAGAVPAQPSPRPVHSWTGCYINGGVGYGMYEQDEYTNSGPLLTGSIGGEGWVGTVGGGCDYQIGSHWVIGALVDYDLISLSGYFKDQTLGYTGNQTETGALAAGGRVGYLVTPKLLTYFNLGYDVPFFDRINLVSATPPFATPYYYPAHTYSSGFVFCGAGTEYALEDLVPLKGLFWRTEYRYVESGFLPGAYSALRLPLMTTGSSPNTCPSCSLMANKDVQTIISGFVWRFNYGGS